MFTIKKGLDVPIAGQPATTISQGRSVSTVALVADDYVGMKPTMAVAEGDRVQLGQLLFSDKKVPGVRFTAPGAGTVKAVNRGLKRKFESVVIELDGDEAVDFGAYQAADLTPKLTRDQLVASGLWTALRTRPFNRTPAIDSKPSSIFVTAIDTSPLAGDPEPVIAEAAEDFILGLHALKQLTEGTVYVCRKAGSTVPGADVDGVSVEDFEGPHPAGLPGTHIHLLDPVSGEKTVWFIGYQDVIAFGYFFRTGQLKTERVVSLAGPSVKEPRLIRTRLGACLDDLVADELKDGEHRVISGSVLSGRASQPTRNYLGRFHMQISVIEEGRKREFLGWAMPGLSKLSVTRTFASFWMGGSGKQYNLHTNMGGSRRAMVPIGVYEKVLPIDTVPTFLLRALIVGDTEQAQALGCLELDEEDLALCTFVCPSKYEYGPILRKNLTTIEKEG